MCGIVGYIGHRNASDFLLEGLRRLEYRGYDSAGICEQEPRSVLPRQKPIRLNVLCLRCWDCTSGAFIT